MSNYSPRFPVSVPFSKITSFETFDERLSALDCVFVNIIGVEDGFIELCSDQPRPTPEERLAWDWLVDPSRSLELARHCDGELQTLIQAFAKGEMCKWWKRMSGAP